MQEFSLVARDLPENTLMECVGTLAPSAYIRANLPFFPENRFPGAGEGI